MANPLADEMATGAAFHRLPWADFDAFARMQGDVQMVRRLRRAERSRRKLLLHALMETAAKAPELFGPLPALDAVWELLARVEDASPVAFDRLLTHPYTGTWAGYTTRLLRNGIDGVGPLWIHLGHVHAIAAAAAIRAGLDFEISVPLWEGKVILPSLGMARLPSTTPFSVAGVRGAGGRYVVANDDNIVPLPQPTYDDALGWWPLRRCRPRVGTNQFSVFLDDVDPYRGLYEPVTPQRLDATELREWDRLLDEAWQLLVATLPNFASTTSVGLNSLVPRPRVLFRNPSASTGEAFGSAVVGLPADGAALASTLVHEFQHIVLGGILHLTRLYDADPRERFYVPWRDDPRPLGGALQGVYAFFGVAAFWRALTRTAIRATTRRAEFEFAYWRQQSWETLLVLRKDASLTDAGRRFLIGIADVLGPWQDEQVSEEIANLAAAVATDHRAGWRVRHLRPRAETVAEFAEAWLAGESRPPIAPTPTGLPPTPVPDGPWSTARADLIRIGFEKAGSDGLRNIWHSVPDAWAADFAYATGRFTDAAQAYRRDLSSDPNRPTSLVGLGLALAATRPGPTSRALLHCPELVRAVHRELRRTARQTPTPEDLASWIGQVVSG